ncbi:MAG TPA: peptidylprolyl isomerase [Bacteroidales bacterium]|nr:peptidylprolyl isomerase [Bacteroidales bacterium]
MKIRESLLILFSLVNATCSAQLLSDQILMNIDGRGVTAGEFTRMYLKSADAGKNPGDINDYLQQFIIFKLKVTDAIHEGIDTTKAFRNELNGYRNQLAQNYLTDSQVKEKLLQKTYQHSLIEINAWHILVTCPESAKPEDTLSAWQKATAIRERILSGESFEEVARGTSDDPSVKINGGNLGYFTVFQMIMPFEEAAYNLKKGAVSEPVRTPYGYHIIKVTDKRASKGRILVAHIMKASPPGTSDQEAKQAEESINAIYNELQTGASFSSLASKYSDHKESAASGGKLNWFGTGEIIPDFSEAAFAISDTGKYTKPIRTIYGWHIIKLLARKAPGTFEETRSYLESKINQSYLNSLSKKSFVDKLKKEYNFSINQGAREWFVKNTDTLIISGTAKYNRNRLPSGSLYTFADQRMSVKDFVAFIEERGSIILTKDPSIFINQTIDASISDRIVKYENSILEKKYPDFRYLMNEFHDGILLFEISGRKVWNRVQEDSTGLKGYYEGNKQNYLTKRSIEGKLYLLHDQKGKKSLYSAYRKYSRRSGTDKLLIAKFNSKNDSMLTITESRWFKGDDNEIDNIQWVTGPQNIEIKNFPAVIVINRVIDPEPIPFKDLQGEIMTAYQDYLEKEWIIQLKREYTVKIDDLVFDKVKKSLKNE